VPSLLGPAFQLPPKPYPFPMQQMMPLQFPPQQQNGNFLLPSLMNSSASINQQFQVNPQGNALAA